jgi:deazaflavin-dependent oxidoreductase (nitroreductase family)
MLSWAWNGRATKQGDRKGSPWPLRKEDQMLPDLQIFAEEDFCYLTTTGRVSGRSHTIEIWFALNEQTLYMLSGGGDKSDWVKNALRSPAVQVKINDTLFSGQARLVDDTEEDTLARKLVFEKYVPRSSDDLTEWARTALPVVVDVAV